MTAPALQIVPETAPKTEAEAASDACPTVTHTQCQKVSQVLARVGDKWTVLVVMNLRDGPLRFNEIRRTVEGVSQRMLTLTLRGLERDGMVSRKVYPTIPPRVEYALTPLGRSLSDPVGALGQWAMAHLDQIDQARHSFDQRAQAQDR